MWAKDQTSRGSFWDWFFISSLFTKSFSQKKIKKKLFFFFFFVFGATCVHEVTALADKLVITIFFGGHFLRV